MQTKLTLRLEDRLIIQAKRYAEASGKSLSQLVSNYFVGLHKPSQEKMDESLPPLTRALKGILKTTNNISEKDYDKYREDKYL